VLNGDCPLIQPETLERLVELFRSTGSGAALITTDLDDPTGYGRIIRNTAGDVQAIVEHKAATEEERLVREINVGFYCFDAAAFWKHVHDLKPDNPAHEYYLTDMIAILLRAGHRVTALKAEDSSEMLGINNRVELAVADRTLRDRKVRQLMLDGVTIEKPETVTIDAQVKIGMDTVVGPFAQILGDTTIGEDCRIGASCIVENSTLEDGAEAFPFTSISACTLGKKAQVGPYARLRMGAVLEEDAHVGNFVELKKTRLGKGSKSMHLAYLGDSTIGSKVNIGAGTITCNYDGAKKHPTLIGDGSFIGSNSTLVAPIEIGDGAYIGAGSVITDAVPDKALALGRARQVVKEGWVRKNSGS
jgi:bifunctional UDP-N-acetylglucosamine pyrophosphorylase/glucosamine-1-phosphate N-acetyltransferase